MTEKQQKIISKELQRGRKLLSEKRVGKPLAETEAEPTAQNLGALAGIGLKSDSPTVQGNLYVFESWDESEAAVNRLDDETLPSGYHQVTAMNGVLVFLARARINTDDGKLVRQTMNKMLSAFSGDE